MMKKAQAQIITTVLIILLVLAAIVIVWQVVSGTIEEGGEQVEDQSVCLGINLDITHAFAGDDTILVKRNIGGSRTIDGLRVFVGDATVNDTKTGLEIQEFNVTNMSFATALASGDEIEVAAYVGDFLCPPTESETVA